MENFNYVGIDVSKLTFDVAIESNGKYVHHKFKNNEEGFAKLFSKLNPDLHCCVMEASGPYYLKLAFYLAGHGIAVSVVNPLVIRRFSQMRLLRSKTDKKDALTIANYGKTERPELWEKTPTYILELKQMQAHSQMLNKNRSALVRQVEAFSANPVQSAMVMQSCNDQVKSIDQQLKFIEKGMRQIIEKEHKEQYKQLKSIPGIGSKTAMELIVASAGFTKFTSAKQLCSYIGLSPRIFESGTSVKGKSRICKMGMSRVRAILYVCTWSAKKSNKACRELFERLVEKGKPKKVALIAVANKLLKQAFAIATGKQYYDENKLNFSCI